MYKSHFQAVYNSDSGDQSQWETYGYHQEGLSSSFSPSTPSSTRAAASSNEEDSKICRDFTRNVCNRGARCKFKHPKLSSDESGSSFAQNSIGFCHDFQNKRCGRNNCRFLHCTREEEQEYLKSGYLPPHLREQAIKKVPSLPLQFGIRPICKDFMKGECGRGNCKFRHLSPMEYDMEMNQMVQKSSSGPPDRKKNYYENDFFGDAEQNFTNFNSNDNSSPMKRGRPPGWEEQEQQTKRFIPSTSSHQVNNEMDMLRLQNSILTQRLEEFKKQVQSLTTTNEFLLDQNAQLRLGVKGTTTIVNAQGPPPMSVTPASGAVVSMSVQPLNQPTVSMSVPTITLAEPHSVSMAAVASMAEPTITIAALDHAIMSEGQELPPPHVAPPQAAATANTVHVQETRIVRYPITSLRQAM